MSTTEPMTEAKMLLKEARACVKRRELFHKALTPELLDALEEYFGTDNMFYAFRADDANPFNAVKRDTLMGAMKSLRHEASEEMLALARTNLEKMETEVAHA